MNNEVKITKFFPVDSETLFRYFVQPNLLEKWAYPDGMSLRVPLFEAKAGGKYRFEHTSKDGKFVCNGYIKEFVPNEKLIQVDAEVIGPDGKVLFKDLPNSAVFTARPGGTQVQVFQGGFLDEAGARDCEQGWTQSLNHLSEVIHEISDIRRGISDIGDSASL